MRILQRLWGHSSRSGSKNSMEAQTIVQCLKNVWNWWLPVFADELLSIFGCHRTMKGGHRSPFA